MEVFFAIKSVFLFLIISLGIVNSLTLSGRIQLIKSLTRQFNRDSIIFLSYNIDELHDIFILEKYLNNPMEYYTGFWDFKRFSDGLYSDKDFIPPKALMVVEYSSVNMKELGLISRRMNMAVFDWLVLPAQSSESDSHIENIIIPFNCRFIVSLEENSSVVLNEVYKISRNSELIKRHFGRWNTKNGLHNMNGEFFNNRMNLRKHEFRFAIHNLTGEIDPCMKIQTDNGGQIVQCAHYQVWNDLAPVFNFTTTYILLENCYKNGTVGLSTPMLEMIRSGEVDSGNGGYIWSASRLLHNKFFLPLLDAKVIMVTKIPSRKFSFSSYVHPFATYMWLALIGWLLLSGVVINFIKHIIERSIWCRKVLINSEYIDNGFLPFTAICYQGSYLIPKETATRFAYLMIYLIPVVFIPSYSGALISSLSVPSDNIPFNDLNELEEEGSYKLSAINSTYFHLFLMTDEKFEVFRQKKLVSTEFPLDYEQSFQEICSKKVTFVFEWPIITRHSIHCNVYKIDLFLQRLFSSMPIQKNFPYVELFNRKMQKFISAGLNTKMLERVALELLGVKVNPFPQNFFHLKPFGFRDVLPLFAVLAGGMSISVFILFVERRIKKKETDKNV